MDKKYEITDTVTMCHGNQVYQIKALKDFDDVKAGDLGGYIQYETNLSQDGNCWIYDDAVVMKDARVFINAKIRNTSIITDNAVISDNVNVFGNSVIKGYASVSNNASIVCSHIIEHAKVFRNARIENARVEGNAAVYGNALVIGNASIEGNAVIKGDAKIVSDYNKFIKISGNSFITDNGLIEHQNEFITCENVGSRFDTITFYKGDDDKIYITTGCFRGDIEKFKDKLKTRHGHNEYAKEYKKLIKLAKAHIYR